MEQQAMAYLLFGLVLVAVLAGVIVYYYAGKRHKEVEEPKYRMLKDDD